MAPVDIDTFNCRGIVLVSSIVNMRSWIDHIQISHISVCKISTSFWGEIYDSLYSLLGSVHTNKDML